MGDRTQNPIIHHDKLFGGRETAQEVHRRLTFGPNAKCDGCGAPPAIRISIFVALTDMSADLRHAVAIQIALGQLNTVQLINGPGVRTSFVHACERCQTAAETAAARGAPSYAFVDVLRGPKPDAPMIQVVSG